MIKRWLKPPPPPVLPKLPPVAPAPLPPVPIDLDGEDGEQVETIQEFATGKPEESAGKMMADVTGIPEGEDGAQKAQEEATGMGPGAMEDITGMKEGESEPEIDLDKITGMGPGAWGDITGMPSRPTKTGSRIVSRRRQPTWRRNTQPGIGRTQY